MFTGGKLRLKGDSGSIGKKKKKKSKSKEATETAAAVAAAAGEEKQAEKKKQAEETAAAAGGAGTSTAKLDRRTDAERRHDEAVAAREAERVAKLASQSHRDRVAAFNAHLATLSEHHDIPKVGPG